LSDAERDAILGLGSVRRFPRGALLMLENEPGERVMIVLAGRAKVSRADTDGHELILSLRDPGDLLGELSFIDGEPRIATVTALEPLEAAVVPADVLRRHLETAPRAAVALLEVVTHRFRDATVKRLQFAASDTLGRVAARIVELADRYGEPADAGVTIAMPISQEELAAWVGSSRAGVAHALQALRDLGWVQTERRRLVVRDLEAMRNRAA
jgi:CRP-like cAMP-binding protein